MKKVLSFALSMVLLFGSSLLALPAAAAIQTEKSLQAIPSTVSGAYIGVPCQYYKNTNRSHGFRSGRPFGPVHHYPRGCV